MRTYRQPVPANETAGYDAAVALLNSLLASGQVSEAPLSIVDWVVAWNLLSQGVLAKPLEVPTVKASEVYLSPGAALTDLAQQLTLGTVDKERIARILIYLGRYENDMSLFDTLPDEVVEQVALRLNCKSITVLCRVSANFAWLCSDSGVWRTKVQSMGFSGDLDPFDLQFLRGLCARLEPNYQSHPGQLYVFGRNQNGQLGLGDKENRLVPTLFPGFGSAVGGAIGGGHTLILRLWCKQLGAIGRGRH